MFTKPREYGVTFDEVEHGVTGVAMLVRNLADGGVVSVSVSGPSIRLTKSQVPRTVTYLRQRGDCAPGPGEHHGRLAIFSNL